MRLFPRVIQENSRIFFPPSILPHFTRLGNIRGCSVYAGKNIWRLIWEFATVFWGVREGGKGGVMRERKIMFSHFPLSSLPFFHFSSFSSFPFHLFSVFCKFLCMGL